MTIERIDRLHSKTELALAIVNGFCDKHNQKPEFCGATREARKLLGDILTALGPVIGLAVLLKSMK